MDWFTARIKWVMLVSGVLTSTMFLAVLAPRSALRATFGISLTGPVAEVVVRNWGGLIGIVGVLLIYGAFHPEVRRLILAVAVASKALFILLVFLFGRSLLGPELFVPVLTDLAMVVIFAHFLRRDPAVSQLRGRTAT